MTVSAQAIDPASGTWELNLTKGYADWDSIALARIDAYSTEFTQSRNGTVTISATRVVSKDGKTMTISGKGTGA